MIRMSLSEKIDMLENIITSNMFTLIICISFIVIALILLNVQKFNREMVIKSCIGVYIIGMICLVVEYYEAFGGMIDYLINNVFFQLLFPSIATYIITVVIANIIIIWSLFSKKSKNIIRKLNIVIFCFLGLILFLVLNIIQTNNIDVYSSVAVYTNKQLFVLIELNMGIFVIWMLGLLIYKMIKHKLKEDFSKEPINFIPNIETYNNKYIPSNEIIDNFKNYQVSAQEIIQPQEKEIVFNEVKEPEIKLSDISKPEEIITEKEALYIQPEIQSIIEAKSLNSEIKNNLNVSLNDYVSDFTLEEYKLLSRMLKERKN